MNLDEQYYRPVAATCPKGLIKHVAYSGLLFLIIALLSFPVFGQGTGLPEDDTIDRQIKGEIIDSVCAALNKTYVFPDVAKEMEKLVRGKLKKKEYDKIDSREDFARTLTDDLRSVSHDLHLWLRPASPEAMELSQEDSLTDEELTQMIEEGKYNNFDFIKVERLPAGGTAIAALNFLAYTDALIIDLRENGGGSPSMIQLISSYFFDETKHLNSFYVRETDSIQQFWTQAFVQGPRMTDVDLYILIFIFLQAVTLFRQPRNLPTT